MQVTELNRRLAVVAVPGLVADGCDGGEVIAALGGEDAIAKLHHTQGTVNNVFTFNQPADFLHIAKLPIVTDEEPGPNMQDQGFEMLPPFFTKIGSIANIFKETVKTKASSKKDVKVRKSQMLNPVAHFDDPEIPTKPLESTRHTSLDRDLMKALKKLFTMRKIWLRTSMDEYLAPRFTSWRKKNAFARICYIFADGPWRGCMCRLGYDPRKDPNAKIYQIIDFRDPYYRTISWKTEKQTNAREGNGTQTMPMPLDEAYAEVVGSMRAFNPELHFLTPPSRPSQLYQLCDIFDAGIQKLIHSASIETDGDSGVSCSKTTGESRLSPIVTNCRLVHAVGDV
ncbi:RNA polymerase III transcription factor (TF)IIIC, putative [Babesia ovata]|uniref:RNA polymerase III transcription factor (TF)IIIC, putative n=1 Tax=Babesia ovata TaxID=189622 RepID=A0A2H6K9D3_9APIC|nr:RNA polymerase III transcription factor (TF)IIIC, putative [Babesia ovata]GBE59588.1 RNA polymerase III transcription factor (TF)IIIC, putative [Babesia ovata]